MALENIYQDPYERQTLSQYRGDPREDKRSVAGSILSFAKNLAVFGLAIGAVRFGAKHLSGAVGSIIKKVGIKGGALSDIISQTTKAKTALNNNITSNWSSDVSVYKKWTQHWDRIRKVQKRYRFGDYARVGELTRKASKFERDRIAAFWKAENLPARLTGKVVHDTSRLLRTSTEFYFANKLLGLAGTRDSEESAPWYNLPAQIKDYAKFTASTIPMLLAFNNLGSAFRFTKEVGSSTLVKAAEYSGLGRLAPSILGKVASKIPYVYGITAGIGSFYGALKYAGLKPLTLQPRKSLDVARKAFAGSYRRAVRMRPPTTAFINDVISGLEEAGVSGEKRMEMFTTAVKAYKGDPRMRFLEKMFKLKSKTLDDGAINSVVKGLPRKSAKFWRDQLKQASKRGISLYDKGIYRGAHGLIDLKNISPKRVLDNTLNFLVEHVRLHVGSTNVSIPGLFKLDTVAAYKPVFRLLHPGDTFAVGRGIGTGALLDPTSRGIYKVEPDNYGLYLDGSFFNVRSDPLKKGVSQISHVTPKGVKFKMYQSGQSDAFNEVVINRAMGRIEDGFSNRAADGMRDMPALERFFTKTLDIKQFGTAGMFARMKGVFHKYFHPESPLRLEVIERVALSGEPGMRDAYIRVNQALLNRGGTLASKLFRNPEVLKWAGFDANMAPEKLLSLVSKTAKDSSKNTLGERLLRTYDVRRIMSAAKGDMDYQILSRTVKTTADGYTIKGKEALLEYLSAQKVLSRGAGAASFSLQNFTETMMNRGMMTEQQSSALRVWLTRHIFQSAVDDAKGSYTPELIQELKGMLTGYQKDLNWTVKSLYTKGMKSFIEPFNAVSNSMRALSPELSSGGYSIIPRGDSAPIHFFAPTNPEGGTTLKGFMPSLSAPFNNVFFDAVVNRSTRLFEWFGLGLDPTDYKTGADLFARGVLMRRVLPVAGAITAWDIADKAVDACPLFDGTILNEGLNTAIAEQGVKGRMLFARINDDLGITTSAKYAEGLMPGFIDSPAMRAMRGAVVPLSAGAKLGGILGGPAGAGYGLLLGVGLGATQGFGAFDITKSEDELKDIYSGRETIPYRRGRWWLLSSSPWKGNRIQAFLPNWFARMKAKHKSNPEGLGSPLEQILYKPLPMLDFNPIAYVLGGSRHYAFKHYYSQPAPETGVPFSEFPIVGPTLAATVGRMMLPPREMHIDEVNRALTSLGYGGRGHGNISAFQNSAITVGGGDNPLIPGTSELRRTRPISPVGIRSTIDRQIYNLTEFTGLWGFMAQTMTDKVGGFQRPFEDFPVLASSNEITSFRRSYWDANIGDPFAMTEMYRRFVPRPRGMSGEIETFNPICLTEDSMIATENMTIKKVRDIEKGDKIFGFDYTEVIQKSNRKINERVYSIKLYDNFENVWLTHDHPLYVIKTRFCHNHCERNIVCVKNRLDKTCEKCGCNDFNERRYKTRQYYRDYTPDWINVEDINKYDFVGYPILKTNESYKIFDSVDFLMDYYNKYNKNKIWRDNSQNNGKKYDRFINLDYNFGFLCGLYLSEGSSSSKGNVVKFALHKGEYDILGKYILEWFNSKGIKGNIYKASLNGIEVNIYSKYYNKLFLELFHNTTGIKCISDFILYHFPKRFLLGLFHGHFEGDGSIKSSRDTIKSSSSSLSLILSLRNLLLQFKCVTGVYLYKPTGSYHLSLLSGYEKELIKLLDRNYGYKIKLKSKKLRNTKKSSWHKHFFEGDVLFTMVTSVQTEHYNGYVYDIQVNKGESFTTPFMLLHNCNRMPSWMDQKYRTGNPFTKMPYGELLLPGLGHETAFDVDFTWPATAEMLGTSVPDATRIFLGLYPKKAVDQTTSSLDRQNREIMAGANVYNAYNNISGSHDGIIRSARGQVLRKIKNLNDSDLNSFIGPTEQDVSEINFYMREAGVTHGVLQYQWQGRPVLMNPVVYSEKRYDRDIQAVRSARQWAKRLYNQGLGFGGEGYSHIDRLDILSNVAPYGDAYKKELTIVRSQMKGGYDHFDRLNKILKKRKVILMKEELYPYRFRGKVFTPDSEYNNMSLNENIKAASEYSLPERVAGNIWEAVSHTDFPFSRKFFPYRTPLEAYKRDMLYGRSVKMWSEPADHWFDAYKRGFMSKTTPFQGSIPGAWAGTLVGGPGLGTAVGGVLGATYGLMRGVYNEVSGATYVPASIKKGRQINRYFDQLTYTKNMMLYQITGDPKYMDEAKGTMTGLIPSDTSNKSWSYMYRATPPQEKPYIFSFLQTVDPDARDAILEHVPAEVGNLLETKWNRMDGRAIDMVNTEQQLLPMPPPSSAVYAPEVPVEDVKLKTIQKEGLDCFVPNQLILTTKGLKEIQNITCLNRLIDGNGNAVFPNKLWQKNHDGDILWVKFKNTFFDMKVTLTHYMEIAKKCNDYKFKERPASDIRKYNRLKLASLNFKEDISEYKSVKLNEDVGFVLGWYLAEGSIIYSKNKKVKGVMFSLGITEMGVAKSLKTKIETIFNCNVSVYKRDSTSGGKYIQVAFFSTKWAPFFYDLCGSLSHQKKLDDIVFRFPLIVLSSMIRSWFQGDGWVTSKEICVSTNSQNLAIQGWYIIRSCGMEAAMQYVKSSVLKVEDKQYNRKESFRIRIGRKIDRNQFYQKWEKSSYTTLTVSTIKEIYYKGVMYDIGMPDDHHYTTICGTVHNSHDFGLGYYKQARRIANSPGLPGPVNMANPTGQRKVVYDQSHIEIRRTIEIALDRAGVRGSVSLTPSMATSSRVTLINM